MDFTAPILLLMLPFAPAPATNAPASIVPSSERAVSGAVSPLVSSAGLIAMRDEVCLPAPRLAARGRAIKRGPSSLVSGEFSSALPIRFVRATSDGMRGPSFVRAVSCLYVFMALRC